MYLILCSLVPALVWEWLPGNGQTCCSHRTSVITETRGGTNTDTVQASVTQCQ